MSSDQAQSTVPLSPSMAYRLMLAGDYLRVVQGSGSHIEWARQGQMNPAERAEHLRVWMAYQNQELFQPLFGRDNVAPEEVCGLGHQMLLLYLDAEHDAGKRLDSAIRAVARIGGDVAHQVLPMLRAARSKQKDAVAFCDKLRYAQAAELEYLRPLAWRQ